MEGRGDSGTLFLAFPLVDVFGVTTAVDGLLISRENGLVVFDLEPGSSLDMEVVRPRQDDLYVGLHSRFIKQEGLRRDRKTLSFEINVLTFAPFVPPEENGPADVYTIQEDLVAKLEQLTSSPHRRDTTID